MKIVGLAWRILKNCRCRGAPGSVGCTAYPRLERGMRGLLAETLLEPDSCSHCRGGVEMFQLTAWCEAGGTH
eukprot:1108104-Pyramimonas_sp.AAC.1